MPKQRYKGVMANNTKELAAIADAACAVVLGECSSLAAKTGQDGDAMAKEVLSAMRRIIGSKSKWDVAARDKRDGRETKYLIRVQLVDRQALVADSHPELPVNDWGDIKVSGLLNVAEVARQMAVAFHHEGTVTWQDDAEMERRIRTVRVTLSRGGGGGVWRIPYRVGNDNWLAHIRLATERRAEHQRMAKAAVETVE